MKTTKLMAVLLLTAGTVAPFGAGPVQACQGECRGLGVLKVQVADEHCGLVGWERKEKSLAAACDLAGQREAELRAEAREKARRKCSSSLDSRTCGCEEAVRRWENVYSNVLTQRCWAECGWAHIVSCEGVSQPAQAPAEPGTDRLGADATIRRSATRGSGEP